MKSAIAIVFAAIIIIVFIYFKPVINSTVPNSSTHETTYSFSSDSFLGVLMWPDAAHSSIRAAQDAGGLSTEFPDATIVVSSSTIITRGVENKPQSFADLIVGDTLLVKGTFDKEANVLRAKTIEAEGTRWPQITLQGKVLTAPNRVTSIDATGFYHISVATGDKNYTLYVPSEAPILSKASSTIAVTDLKQGDMIEFYGGDDEIIKKELRFFVNRIRVLSQ